MEKPSNNTESIYFTNPGVASDTCLEPEPIVEKASTPYGTARYTLNNRFIAWMIIIALQAGTIIKYRIVGNRNTMLLVLLIS